MGHNRLRGPGIGGSLVKEVIDWSGLESYIEKRMEEQHVPGLSIAVSRNGALLYEKGFGYRDVSRGLPVTPQTVFGIASVTKSITALAILLLVKEGKLGLDDPIRHYLPELQWQTGMKSEQITIRHLLSHSTGVPPLLRKEHLLRFDEHIQYINELEYQPLGEAGEYYSYCNDIFLLAGAIIERVTGKLYRRFVTESILSPLGMDRSTFSLEELARMDNVSIPYEYVSSSDEYRPVACPSVERFQALPDPCPRRWSFFRK